MMKKAKWVIVLLAAVMAFGITACNKTPPPPEEPNDGPTMPTIADISVNELRTKPIGVAGADTFTYTFDGNNISIADGTVKGITAGTTTRVTAKSSYGETAFNVTVTAAFEGSAFTRSGDGFIKTGASYGESFCLLDGQPFDRDGLIATGSLGFDAIENGAEARIILRGTTSDVYLSIAPTTSGFTAKGVAGASERVIGTYGQTRAHFMVFVKDNTAYYYLNDTMIWQTPVTGNVRLGFGSGNVTAKLTRLTVAYNEAFVEELLQDVLKPFGAHTYGGQSNNEGCLVDIGGGAYKKFSYQWEHTWLYYRGQPVCGSDFTVSGTMEMLLPEAGAQALILACNAQGKIMRILISYNKSSNTYDLLTGYEVSGSWPGGPFSRNNISNKIDFTFTYKDGVGTFKIGDEIIGSMDSGTAAGVGNLGDVHFGFAGMNCQMVVSDITATVR